MRSSPSVGTPTNCTAGAACTISGLNNGEPYIFSVQAVNEHGAGEWSAFSDQITPYGTPTNVGTVSLAQSNRWAPGTISASWPAVGGTGGTTTYNWRLNGGAWNQTTGLDTGPISGLGAGDYSVQVFAQNPGGKRSPGETTSNTVTVRVQPAPGAVQNLSTPGGGEYENTTLTWTWNPPANATADAALEGLQYDWVTNTGASGTTSGTSASLSVGPGTYSISVTPRNSGGAGPAASSGSTTITKPPPPPPPTNTAAVTRTCLVESTAWYAYNTCSNVYVNAGDGVWAYCRGTQNGVWWYYITEAPYAGYFIRAEDTNRHISTVPTCGEV